MSRSWMRTVRSPSRYVPEATRNPGMSYLPVTHPDGTSGGRSVRHDFGWKVWVRVLKVFVRRAPSQPSAFAVYISPYP